MNTILYSKNKMKPLLKIINTSENESFQIMRVNEPFFFPSWHFHPECEIMLVLEGRGIRFAGDNIERFQAGDLVFFGSNIPHFYRSDEEFYKKDSNSISKAIVLYFKEEILHDGFWNLNNITPIRKMILNSKRGIKFNGRVKDEIAKQMEKLDDQTDDLSKIIDLLTILKTMSAAK
ncbi:MAG: cupin domain-containing protein [Candidatus Nitrosocosmicus sp.]